MIDSYWDLYVAYIAKCVRDNWNNDIDPNHYEMEWNHFLPKSVFGDWTIGQWLTLRQHAIASSLQTIALKKNCMFGWHKRFLPPALLTLSWSYYVEMCRNNGVKVGPSTGEKNLVNQKGFLSPGYIQSDEYIRGKVKGGVSGGRAIVERGIGCHTQENRVKGGQTAGKLAAENKTGCHSPEVLLQRWKSLEDGFVSTASAVSKHNRKRGWDPNARVRVHGDGLPYL
jgi:hypothetical protein